MDNITVKSNTISAASGDEVTAGGFVTYDPIQARNLLDFAVKQSPGYDWKPQPDITAYELALCMPILIGHWAEGVAHLPNEARRHFVVA